MKTGQEDVIQLWLPRAPCLQWTGVKCICICRLVSEWDKERCYKNILSPAGTSYLSPSFHWVKCQSTCCCGHHIFLTSMYWDALPGLSELNHPVTFPWLSQRKEAGNKSEDKRMILDDIQSTVLMQTLFSGSTSFFSCCIPVMISRETLNTKEQKCLR